MSIPLPPLPVTHPEECIVVNADDIRARDLEIARVVLEAAAKKFPPTQGYFGRDVQEIIRALEFHHE